MADQEQGPSFDEQLAELQRMVSGRGGIGSDARTPVQNDTRPGISVDYSSNPMGLSSGRGPGSLRDRRLDLQIQNRAMRGLPPTPDQELYLNAVAPEKAERSERLAGRDTPFMPYPLAQFSGIPQVEQAASSIGEAYQDPTAPNVLGAVKDTALASLPVTFNKLAKGMEAAGGAATSVIRSAPKTSAATLGAGAILATPSEAGKATLDPRQTQIEDLRKEQDAARKTLEKFATQNFQSKTARENASKPYLDQISGAQTRIDGLTAAMDKDAQEAADRGRPIREYLPPIMASTLPIWAGVAGGLLARRGFNKYNAEYNSALEGYRGAEKAGNAAEMAVRKNQLAGLEANTPWKDPSTYLAAGLPLELRTIEHVIDANRDPETRAYQDAQRRIHDPVGMAFDVGSGLFSSATALGLGAKLSKDQPERSLGRAIASENAYASAPEMAEQLGTALRAGEALKALRPSSPAAAPEERSLLQRLLGIGRPKASAEPIPTTVPSSSAEVLPPTRNVLAGPETEPVRLSDRIRANPVPEISGPSSQPASKTPDVLIRTTDSRGIVQYRDLNGNYASHPQKGDKTKVVRKGKAEAPPEKPSEVFNDDLRPYGYRNKLDPQE